MKYLILMALSLLVSAKAQAYNEFMWSNTAMDYYVPQNLMSLVNKAQINDEDNFLKQLKCWDVGSKKQGRIICQSEGQTYAYDFTPNAEYTPQSLLMTIPGGLQ